MQVGEQKDVVYSARTISCESEDVRWACAHSTAKMEAFRNFLLAYFLQTYCLEKFSSASFSTSIWKPGMSCSSVYPE